MSNEVMRRKRRIYLVPASYVFTPNRDDVINSRLRVRYSATCDTYYRDWSESISLVSNNVMPGWERGVFALDSVYRNVDEVTGEVYFDRIKNTTTGNLKWKFDFSSSGLLVDEVTIRLDYLETHGGEITTTITGNGGTKRLRYIKGGEYVTYNELQNSSEVVIVVHFIGDANQTTKLFPQKIMGGIGYPMDIKISLKAPSESLGKPRVLLGLMYSNAQEISVDSRHYKETGSLEPCRGFLHVHFHEAKDLPEQKGRVLESSAKCYLLPSKRKVKCKSVTKKGRNPLWNEQFLMVGVGFIEVKKQALEFCLMTNHKKAKRMIGGFRLSLGYRQIMAAQAGKANAVISKLLMSKPSTNDSNQNRETSSGNEMRGLARLAIAMDKKEKEQQHKNGIHHAQVNGDIKTGNASVKSVHPEIDTKTKWKMTSMDELRTLDRTTTLQSSTLATLRDSCSATKETRITSNSKTDSSNRESVSIVVEKENVTLTKEQITVNGKERVDDSTKDQVTVEKENVSLTKQEPNNEIKVGNPNPDGTSVESNASTTPSTNNDNNVKTITKLLAQGSDQSKHQSHQSNVSNSLSPTRKPENKSFKEGNNNNIDQIKKSQSTADIPVDDHATVSCSSALTRRWNSDRHIKRDEKKKDKKSQLEKILGEGLDEMTLDAVGLEVKQWENVVNKPKQWHYCWHILRKDMIPVHNARS